MLTAVLLVLRNRTYVPPADTDIPFTAEDMPSGALIRRTSENGETPESYNFLVLGVDRVASLADTVMIISLKTDGGISVVQLPRDIYVDRESAGLDGDGGIKLNSLYAALGAERFAAFLSGSLCVKIDYSLTVGTDVFADAVDAVGGVEINVPADMERFVRQLSLAAKYTDNIISFSMNHFYSPFTDADAYGAYLRYLADLG